jgi:hypothetical protein
LLPGQLQLEVAPEVEEELVLVLLPEPLLALLELPLLAGQVRSLQTSWVNLQA